MSESSYIFALDYGQRVSEKAFIRAILQRYDNTKLIGANIFVNNNPYHLEFYLHLNFEGDTLEFEDWLVENYPDKKRKYNYFVVDFLTSIGSKGYNSMGLLDGSELDFTLTDEAAYPFLLPSRTIMDSEWQGGLMANNFKVFLCHSSKDKLLVDKIFDTLQKSEIKAWYDKYEIDPGDSIFAKINDGLESSDLGLIVLSKNTINAQTGWAKDEMAYFFQERMRSGKSNFIVLNVDLSLDDLPPIMRGYRFIDMSNNDAYDELIRTLQKKQNQVQ
jgi:hypothetical protein